MKTFECEFGGGVSCRVLAPDSAPPRGAMPIRDTLWTGRPTRTMLRSYVQWMNSVYETLAAEWGISMLHVFRVARHEIEIWTYEPGKPARLLEDWPDGELVTVR